MPRPFHVKDAKYLLLTYPQVNETERDGSVVQEPILPWRLLELCTRLGAECIVGREQHADGGTHYHAFLDFGGRPFSTRDTRKFDIDGHHPNIERVGRTPELAYDYATKDCDIICGGATRPIQGDGLSDSSSAQTSRPNGSKSGTGNGMDWEFITSASTREEFFIRIHERAPKALVCSYVGIAKYADWKYRVIPNDYSHPEDWEFDLECYPGIREWYARNILEGTDSR